MAEKIKQQPPPSTPAEVVCACLGMARARAEKYVTRLAHADKLVQAYSVAMTAMAAIRVASRQAGQARPDAKQMEKLAEAAALARKHLQDALTEEKPKEVAAAQGQ